MPKETYEVLPQKLIEDLKYDVEALKKKLNEPDSKTNELILEIESLKDSIHDLNSVFNKALKQSDEEDIYKSIKGLNDKIASVISQNETIAKGMIAISDKVDTFVNTMSGPKNQIQRSQPSMNRPQRSNLPPQMANVGRNMSMVPPPPMNRNQIQGGPPNPPGATATKRKRSFF